MGNFYSVTPYFLDSKKWCLFFLFVFWGDLLLSQRIPDKLLPMGKTGIEEVKPFRLSRLDNQKLLKEELEKRKNGVNPSFAVTRTTKIRPSSEGEWTTSGNGKNEIWRLGIQSPGALSLNLGISDFYLPPNASLWLYNRSMTQVEGPFDYNDNEVHGQMWTPVIEGDEILVEVWVPSDEKKWLKLNIEKVNHDFQGFFSLLTGNCHLDVACGAREGWKLVDNYRDIMRSVGMFTINGRNFCSGALINNGRNDCKPYFLSAFHCDVNTSNAPSVVVYWNYEHSVCRPMLSQVNGSAGDGSKSVFNSGAYFRAGYAPSDFILLELDDPVRDEANPYYAGWDASASLPEDTLVCIHHPNTQEKRMAISYRKTYRGQWGQLSNEVTFGNHLIIPRWDVGTTEDGSSGGPLINKNRQIVGQLHGGAASCANNSFDAFGWFYSSWIGGGSPMNRLSEWLDPENTGIKNISGRNGVLCKKGLATNVNKISICSPDNTNIQVFAGTAFTKPVTFDLIGATAFISYVFNPVMVPPGGMATLNIASKQGNIPAENKIRIRGISGNDTVFTDVLLTLNKIPGNVLLKNSGNDVGIEPTLTWFNWPGASSYQIEIAKDSIFNQIISELIILDTTLTVKGLEYNQAYFYRIRARNDCGQSPGYTLGRFNTPLDLRLQMVDLNNVLCVPSDLKARLKIGVGFSKPIQISYSISPTLPTWQFSFQAQDKYLYDLNATAIPDSLKPGLYTVKVVVSDGRSNAETNFNFQLKGLPKKPALNAPEDNEVLLSSRPQISWLSTSLTDNYAIRVARDSQFQEVVFSGERNLNFYKFSQDLQSGAYFWQIKSKNDCGEKASDIRKFKLNLSDLGSLFRWQIAIEPNPVTDRLNIHLSEKLSDIIIGIYSVEGRLLFYQQYPEELNHFSVNIHSFPPGIFIARVLYKQGSFSRRIIKHGY
jgi:hypothetical protein